MGMNYAQKYSPKVDERFARESVTENIGMNRDYDWDGVKTVTVYDIPTVELVDYTRSGENRFGTANELEDNKTDYSITQDKAFTYTIDAGNSAEQMDVKKKEGASLAREIKEVVTPFIDKYRLKKLHDTAVDNNAYVDGTDLAKTNAYEKFLGMNEKLDEKNVPTGNRITFVNPAYYNMLKLDQSFCKNSEIGSKQVINGQVGEVDGNRIIKVPSNYLPTNCVALTVWPKCMTSPKKLNYYNRHENPVGINGLKVEGRILFDAFVLKSKKDAIAVLLTALPSR